jgi:hypothetical protein
MSLVTERQRGENWIGARWEDEAEQVAKQIGAEIRQRVGVSDYQGWAVFLLVRYPLAKEAACLAYSNGDAQPLAERAWLGAADAMAVLQDRLTEEGRFVPREEWGILSWSYGSCSGCDPREDMGAAECLDDLASQVEWCASETDARVKFEAAKGW